MARGAYFDPNVDPRLLKALETVGQDYGPYKVELFSGRSARPKNPSSYHPHGGAVDVNLIDQKTGRALPNIHDPASAAAYQAYANEVMKWAQQNDPQLAEQLRWGGYFKEGTWDRDWMHFDVGGAQNTKGGNWQTGFDPEYMKTAGLQNAGGLGEAAAQMQAAGYSTQQILDALASIESQGSGDYNAVGAEADPAGHRARGRYQIMDYNIGPWAEQYLQRKGVTVEQFMADPKLQDELAGAVMSDYRKQYGDRGAFSKWFTGSEKEPDRSDVHGKLTGKTYADTAMEQLGRTAGTPQATAVTNYNSPSEGGSRFGGSGLGTPTATTPEKKKWEWKDFGKDFASAFAAGGGVGGGGQTATGITDTPRAVLAQAPPTTVGADAMGEDPRAKLAMMMARLNSGKLWI